MTTTPRAALLLASIALTACAPEKSIYQYVDDNKRYEYFYECVDRTKTLVNSSNEQCANFAWDRALSDARFKMEREQQKGHDISLEVKTK